MPPSFQWITLQQAREASFGKVAWWKLPAPNGERIILTTSSEERPVWKGVTGTMYLGGWKDGKWNGLGVFYFPDGCVLSGYWNEGSLLGKAMHVLLPESPSWIENHWPRSSLLHQEKSLPFIYVGCYKGFLMHDDDAIVILKDGTTRRGPWKDNAPCGDWWNEHEASELRWEQLSLLLSFDEDETSEQADPISTSTSTSTLYEDPVLVKEYLPTDDPIKDQHTVRSSTSTSSDSCSTTTSSLQRRESWQSEFTAETTTIADWLSQILSPDANPHEMQYYASRFYQDGFHSIHWIQQHCSTVDVRDWMKKAHVRMLSQQLQSETRIQTIALWLHTIVLGPHVHSWEAYEYAMQLVDEGLLSINDIREFCRPADVQGFQWMKPFHKRRLLAQLEQYVPE